MYTKKSGRTAFKSNRRLSYKKTSGFMNKGRNKGNISQQYSKYLKLAKEASRSGDRIQSEYYFQFTDHYYRLMVELGITIDETNTDEVKPKIDEDQSSDSESETSNSIEDTKSTSESNKSRSFSQDHNSHQHHNFSNPV